MTMILEYIEVMFTVLLKYMLEPKVNKGIAQLSMNISIVGKNTRAGNIYAWRGRKGFY